MQQNGGKQRKSDFENSLKYRLCTVEKCFTDDQTKENDMLQCRKCQRYVHYACSELPLYQIQICLQYKTRSFQCVKCVTISPKLLERAKTNVKEMESDAVKTETTNKDINESDFIKRLCHLEEKIEKLVNKEDNKKESKQMTYADITKEELKQQEVNIKSFIKEEKEEERWLNSTKCNIIVHNMGENKDETLEEQRTGDKDYVEETIKCKMGFDIDIVTTERIGARKDEIIANERWRPIKVTLKSEEEKKRIMASVYKLDKWDFRITDDFSKKEREIIKEWHQKAKEKTRKEKDECCIWKVRGSPRAKLYLKKFCKKNKSTEEL